MSQAGLTATVRRVSETASVIDVIGALTRTGEQALSDAYREASGPRTTTIVLNFERLEYMNSSGIGLLVTMLVRANRQKQRLGAYGLTDHYKEIFALTRLSEAIHIYEGEGEALGG